MVVIGFLISALVLVPPFWFILPRAGIPSTVALVAVLPVGAIILLWVMAIKHCPSDRTSGSI